MSRHLPRPFNMPWGSGQIVEEASAEGEWHCPTVQLLEYEDGSLSVRFCSYTHDGRFQRSPLMLSDDDVPALRDSLRHSPRLAALLRQLLEA